MSQLYCPECAVIWTHESSRGTRLDSFPCPRCGGQCVTPPTVWPLVTHRVEAIKQPVGKPDTLATARGRR